MFDVPIRCEVLTHIFTSFGNFVNRTLKFISSQYGGVIPDSGDAPGPLSPNNEHDADFIAEVNALLKDYIDAMEAVKLRLGLQTIMLLSGRGNVYLQSSGLNKALMTDNPKRCAQVVSRAVNLIYALSALAHPFLPVTEAAMLVQLNAPARAVSPVLSTDILAGHTIGTPEHLFKRIDEKMADVWRAKFGGNKPLEEAAVGADATQAAPGTSKRKAASAAKKAAIAVADGQPKSAEVLAQEQKVADQGQVVRTLKSKPKTPELEQEITAAVDVLKKLKEELASLQKAS